MNRKTVMIMIQNSPSANLTSQHSLKLSKIFEKIINLKYYLRNYNHKVIKIERA
jgi:hypothetical protein